MPLCFRRVHSPFQDPPDVLVIAIVKVAQLAQWCQISGLYLSTIICYDSMQAAMRMAESLFRNVNKKGVKS
jgi:hypothetical protein